MKAMIFHEIEVEGDLLESLLTDPRYWAQQKFDGARMLTRLAPGEEIQFFQRNGKEMKFAAAKLVLPALAEDLADLRKEIVGEAYLDGEIMPETGHYHLWDLVEPGLSLLKYEDRFEALEMLMDSDSTITRASIVRTEHTTEGKRELWERINSANAEGMMFKHPATRYEPGVRVKHSLKAKLVKTADVVVTAFERGQNDAGRETGSADLGVYDPEQDKIITVGACSLIGKPIVEVGDVIEVKYLYLGAGQKMVQPRMVRRRPDKEITDSTFDQFPLYSKAVV